MLREILAVAIDQSHGRLLARAKASTTLKAQLLFQSSIHLASTFDISPQLHNNGSAYTHIFDCPQ
jgi:hypothetical protein